MLGHNCYTYCLNNPGNYKDSDGDDAILLLDDQFPGHIGLLIQDENNQWWHFYWGAANGLPRLLCVSGLDVKAKTWCVEYNGELTLEAINSSEQYEGAYSNMLYLKGDFSESAREAKVANGKYNLYYNSCVHKSLEVLLSSDSIYSSSINLALLCANWHVDLNDNLITFKIIPKMPLAAYSIIEKRVK